MYVLAATPTKARTHAHAPTTVHGYRPLPSAGLNTSAAGATSAAMCQAANSEFKTRAAKHGVPGPHPLLLINSAGCCGPGRTFRSPNGRPSNFKFKAISPPHVRLCTWVGTCLTRCAVQAVKPSNAHGAPPHTATVANAENTRSSKVFIFSPRSEL